MLLITLGTPVVSYADWAVDLLTDPLAESPVPTVPGKMPRYGTVYWYYLQNTTTDSSWFFLTANDNVDICLVNDIDAADQSLGALILHVLYVAHPNLGVAPTDLKAANLLLGITLTGKVPVAGSTTDCYYDVKGPMWIYIDVNLKDADDDGLLSIVRRQFR